MYANVSPVFEYDNEYAFMAKCGSNRKNYKSPEKKIAKQNRAKLIKRLKKDGFTVYL